MNGCEYKYWAEYYKAVFYGFQTKTEFYTAGYIYALKKKHNKQFIEHEAQNYACDEC